VLGTIFKKVVEIFLSLLILIGLSFCILRSLPGGPFDEENQIHPLVQENLEVSWSLNKNSFNQFLSYTQSILVFEMGYSLSYPGKTVASLIKEKVAFSFMLQLLVLIFIIFFCQGLCFLDFRFPILRKIIDEFNAILMALPALFWGPLLISIFAIHFQWLPLAFLDSWKHYILPIIIISTRPTALLSRLQIHRQREMEKMEFVRFSRAKGLSEARIFFVHILKNTLPLTFAALPTLISSLFSGSFLVEVLFSIPGLGSLFVESISNRDYPVIIGITLCLGVLIMILTDFFRWANSKLDPRIGETSIL
jgi:oligopeptide transport system permease protein